MGEAPETQSQRLPQMEGGWGWDAAEGRQRCGVFCWGVSGQGSAGTDTGWTELAPWVAGEEAGGVGGGWAMSEATRMSLREWWRRGSKPDLPILGGFWKILGGPPRPAVGFLAG